MKRRRFAIIGSLLLTVVVNSYHHHCLRLQQHCLIPYSSSRRRSTFTSWRLSAYRERRITIVDNASSSSSYQEEATSQQSKLISAEEAARHKRTGQAKRRAEKAARRENRISQLEEMENVLSDAERAELNGLLRIRENFEEQYSCESFSAEHVEFKRLHNEAFVALARFCQRDRSKRSADNAVDDGRKDPNVFYLDGPDAGTSSVLIGTHGFDPSCCYVANRHLSTCEILQQWLPRENILHATAAEALTPCSDVDNASFSNIDFSAYYFDGCGGFTPHIIGMMSAALLRPEASASRGTTAVGFSLMGGNRDIVEKEMVINRALSNIAGTRGMRTRHVMDDPCRYGIPIEVAKTEGGTFTSWMLLETVE